MTPFEEDLTRSLQLLQPIHPATDQQWQENLARLGHRRRTKLSGGVLAACAAAVVSVLIAGTILAVRHIGSGQPASPPELVGPSEPACSSLSTAGDTVLRGTAPPGTSINLQFTSEYPDALLCVRNDSRVDELYTDPALLYSPQLVTLGSGSTWLLALPAETGDTAAQVKITTDDGSTSIVQRRTAVVAVTGRPVFAVEVAATTKWVRTEFLDGQGRPLQLSKTLVTPAPTRAEAQRAASSMSAAVANTSTEPSTYVPELKPDLSCLPHSTAPTPEYWLVLSCAGTPQNTNLWFGHGGTPADNGATTTVTPDESHPFPYLSQLGIASDVLVSAFPPDTGTAVITLTDGTTVTVGVPGHGWITLRNGWKGMVYRGDSTERAERLSTFGTDHQRQGTQELYY